MSEIPHWESNLEALLTEWVKEEQKTLWHELNEAIRNANNGHWSMRAANVARRIVRAARLVGPTDPDSVPWPLVGGGVYGVLLSLGGVDRPPFPPDYLTETEEVMCHVAGGSMKALSLQFKATLYAMASPREIAYIRGEE